ncbi:MAG: protein kinase [Deltaproteobacteria bacterium]|nr:protein kinase [Deltaproteobacteria bacterium]MBN2673560.1 protein kinase [Deltaproteobacteria bacterium]
MSTDNKSAENHPFKDDMTGRVLLGRYRIVRKLASGGMGVVYLARTEGARGFVKPVVVKLILPTFASDESFLKMFVREAQILSKLNDPGIVSVIDFEQDKNFYIMVLEYVHGFQLREWLRYRESKKKPLPTDVVIEIILKVLEPLHHAHTVKGEDGHVLGIVHQDISPSNILLNTDGRIKLVDFGIARAMEGGDDTTAGSGGFQGKLSYSAPERFSGQPATVKCDLYSVGVTLHQLLVGKNEFYAKSHANTIAQVLNHKPSSVLARRHDAHPDLDKIILKALAKDPDYRYTSALEFADALRPLMKHEPRVVDEQISTLVAEDFNDDMAEFLKVEPLGLREKAWRQPSIVPPPADDTAENTRRITGKEMENLMEAQQSAPRNAPRPRNSLMPEATVSLKPTGHPPDYQPPALPVDDDRTDPSKRITLETSIISDDTAASKRPVMVSAKALVGIVVVIVLAAGAVIAFQILNKPKPKSQNKIVLVQSPVADDLAPTPDTSPSSATRPVDTASSDTTASAADAPGNPDSQTAEAGSSDDAAKPRKKSGKPVSEEQKQLQKLTAAFKKQKNKVKGCFKTHPDSIENIQQISVVFQVNADGSVKSAGVQPAAVSNSSLGPCIKQVAVSTQFPPQKSGVTFTIPVSVQK